MENYYQKEIECASPEKLRELQDERLVKQVKHFGTMFLLQKEDGGERRYTRRYQWC